MIGVDLSEEGTFEQRLHLSSEVREQALHMFGGGAFLAEGKWFKSTERTVWHIQGQVGLG